MGSISHHLKTGIGKLKYALDSLGLLMYTLIEREGHVSWTDDHDINSVVIYHFFSLVSKFGSVCCLPLQFMEQQSLEQRLWNGSILVLLCAIAFEQASSTGTTILPWLCDYTC